MNNASLQNRRLVPVKINNHSKERILKWNVHNSKIRVWMFLGYVLEAWIGDVNQVHKQVLDEEQYSPVIRKALELGINFFDTANVYSNGVSEESVGRALKDFANRDEVVISTKVHVRMHEGPNGGGLSRKTIMSEIKV